MQVLVRLAVHPVALCPILGRYLLLCCDRSIPRADSPSAVSSVFAADIVAARIAVWAVVFVGGWLADTDVVICTTMPRFGRVSSEALYGGPACLWLAQLAHRRPRGQSCAAGAGRRQMASLVYWSCCAARAMGRQRGSGGPQTQSTTDAATRLQWPEGRRGIR